MGAPQPAASPAQARRETATAVSSQLLALMTSLAQEPQRWSWQRGASLQPMSAALRRWLSMLNDSTSSLWRTTQAQPQQSDVTVLRLYRDGELRATLRLDEQGAWATFTTGVQLNWMSPLQASTLAALKRSLSDAAP
jgi:hypothetical protein